MSVSAVQQVVTKWRARSSDILTGRDSAQSYQILTLSTFSLGEVSTPWCNYSLRQTVDNHPASCEWHSITAGPSVLFSNFPPCKTAFSFPYEIILSFPLAAERELNVLLFFLLFLPFFFFLPNFPGLAELIGHPGARFKQLREPDVCFKLHKF